MKLAVRFAMRPFADIAFACCALCLGILGFSAKSQAQSLELVQSVPQNTTLRAPHTSVAADAWLKLVQSATRTIELQGFYVTDEAGTVSEPIFKALADAAQTRGVAVKLLLDSKFFKNSADTVAKLRTVPGIEIRTITFQGVMHAKFFIVDGERAFLGSQNFDWRALTENHELGVILDAPLSARLAQVFASDWRSGVPLAPNGEVAPSLIVADAPAGDVPAFNLARDLAPDIQRDLKLGGILAVSPPMAGFPREIDVLRALVGSARKRIDIQVMNYSATSPKAWGEIKDALTAAAQRGIPIRMTVANWQFTAKGGLRDMQAISRLPKAKVRYSVIPQLPSGCIPYSRVNHAKFMVVDDDLTWIGTGNWTRDYFYSTRNVTLIKRNAELAANTRGVFEQTWNSSYMKPVTASSPQPVAPDVACSGSNKPAANR
jgi:phosphatidylserine/phosphatidylglycerophosphate/cardiolipin synthase-like enzyme